MAGTATKGRGKRCRETTKVGGAGSSGISPPKKRPTKVPNRRKNTRQLSLSEWLTDDEMSLCQTQETTPLNTDNRPATSQPVHTSQRQNTTPTSSQLSTPQTMSMLSPIQSQPKSSERCGSANISLPETPITSALNLAASASSLRKDFATCEQIMNEKHQFMVAMLESMHSKVSNIEEKLMSIESRVQKLEENEHIHMYNAQGIYQAANTRQNDLEKQLRNNTVILKNMENKCEKVDDLTVRMTQMEQFLTQQQHATFQQSTTHHQHSYNKSEKLGIAIYGLQNSDDVTRSVNTLFWDMNLCNVKCVTAHRTASRPEQNRPGVVIAELSSLADKQAVLERKRFLRAMPQYSNVFVKPSKTHSEQVMDANFGVLLNEIPNGDSYYISDNGRIQRNNRDANRDSNVARHGNRGDYRNYDGGARPKTYRYDNNRDDRQSYRDNYHYRNNRNNNYQSYASTTYNGNHSQENRYSTRNSYRDTGRNDYNSIYNSTRDDTRSRDYRQDHQSTNNHRNEVYSTQSARNDTDYVIDRTNAKN